MTTASIRIIFADYVLTLFLCLIVIISLWRQNRRRFPETGFWLADYVLQFAALVLIVFRGVLSDVFTIVLANVFIVGGTILLYEGLSRHVGRKVRQGHNVVMLLVFALAHGYWTHIEPSLFWRTVNQSVALFYICAQCSWLMLRGTGASLRPATRVVGWVFVAFCVVSLVRTIAVITHLVAPVEKNIFVLGIFDLGSIIVYQILFIALTFSLFLMLSRRLSIELEAELRQRAEKEEQLRQSEEKFAKAFLTSPYAIAITRLKDGRFMDVNHAFSDITGYSKEDVLSSSSLDLKLWVNEQDREEMASMLRNGLPVVGREYPFRKKNGEILMGLFSAQIVKISEEPCLLSSIEDITERKRAEEALKESEERYRFIAHHTADHIWMMNLDMRFTYSNPSISKTIGYTTEEFLGKTIDDFFTPESLTAAKNILREELAQENNPMADPNRSRTLESQHYRKDGKTVWLESSMTFIRDANQKPVGIIGISRDITERKFAEKLIQIRLDLFDFAARHTLDELLQKTLDEVTALVDSPIGFYHFVEPDQKTLSLQAWSTRTVQEFCTAKGKGMHYDLDQAGVWVDCVHEKHPVIHNDYVSLPHRKGLPEGHAPVIRELVVPIMREDKIVAILGVGNKPVEYHEKDVEIVSYLADVAWEITERKKAEDQIKHMATHDLLTDLPTLRLAKDRLMSAMNLARRYQKSVALLFIDLDGFKEVNDTLGHEAGDFVLREVARRLVGSVRDTDTVARIGGDEFLIVATEIGHSAGVLKIARNILRSLSEPILYQAHQNRVSASIGIALFPEHGEEMDLLIKLADEAMYRVKNAGKNGICFAGDTPQ